MQEEEKEKDTGQSSNSEHSLNAQKSASVAASPPELHENVGNTSGREGPSPEREINANVGDVKKGGQHAESIQNFTQHFHGASERSQAKESSEFTDPTNECA